MQTNGKFTVAIHICTYMHYSGKELVTSQQIADSVKTNPVVIRRIIAKLREAGIIGSIAGAKGGFFLNKPVEQITLWDIYLAVKENDLFYKPKPNPDCAVGSNLASLVDDSFEAAELSMKGALSNTNISMLNERLEKILNTEDMLSC
ncbi:MAG: Rrf2 family transcriptional regulator [Bacteroidota bacterium]